MFFSNDDINSNYLQNISPSNSSLDKVQKEGPQSGGRTHKVLFPDCRTKIFTFVH